VGHEEPIGRIELLLRLWVERDGPTSRFRRRAWREFQRALDPLAPPKPLPTDRA